MLKTAENMAVAMVEPSSGEFPMFTDCKALVNEVILKPMMKLSTYTAISYSHRNPMR